MKLLSTIRPVMGGRMLRGSVASLLCASASVFSIAAAEAQDTISGATTTPVATATASSGAPADVSITGSIKLTSGVLPAVTLNSSNNVTNSGTITIDGVSTISGILAEGGNTGTITNTGTISITDSTPATTIPLTAGSARYGIQLQGAGALNGSILETGGTISVLGNNSAAILVGSGGLTGSITLAGTTSATGDSSYGLQTLGPVTAAGISITGTVTAFGQGSSAISIGAPVAGQLYINSKIQSNAYYNGGQDTGRPTVIPTTLVAHNLEQAGPAVIVGAAIGGGAVFDTSASVASLGSSPALVIGAVSGATATLSPGATGFGFVNNGVIAADGIYDRFAAIAVQVGGAGGGAAIDGGINSIGTIRATSYSANATGLSFQTGAMSTTLTNSGTIAATVNFGQNGNIAVGGNATAIGDAAGALSQITNSGAIEAVTASGNATALDLRGNTAGVSIVQLAPTTKTSPFILGDVLFGSGNASLDLETGALSGAVSYGSGVNALTLNGGAQIAGAVTEGAGGTLSLNVASGRLLDTSPTNLALSSLKLGAAGEVDIAVDQASGQSGGLTVVGAVIISSGAKIGIDFTSKLITPETVTLVDATSAGALVGQPSILLGEVPFFYVANLATDPTAGTIAVGLRDRGFAEAGVPGNAAAFKAIFTAFDRDPGIFNTFNTAVTGQAFKAAFQQELPAYSGGLFEMMAQGGGALVEAQANNPIVQRGDRSGAWAQQIGFGSTQNSSRAPGYYGGGLGFAFGWESPASPISTIGYSVAYMRGSLTDEHSGPNNQQVGTVYSGGLYWRETDGNFHAIASLNAGVAGLNGSRNFSGVYSDNASFTRNSNARWTGGMGQVHLAVDYEQDLGDDLFIKPSVAGDYFVLYEGAHTDRNGGSALDLKYNSTVGKQGSATGALTFGTRIGEGFVWKPELTIGYKEVFGGPADTVAAFAGGSSFSLAAPSQKSGPTAKIGVHGGDKYTDIAFEAGGEDRGDYRALSGQLVARFNF